MLPRTSPNDPKSSHISHQPDSRVSSSSVSSAIFSPVSVISELGERVTRYLDLQSKIETADPKGDFDRKIRELRWAAQSNIRSAEVAAEDALKAASEDSVEPRGHSGQNGDKVKQKYSRLIKKQETLFANREKLEQDMVAREAEIASLATSLAGVERQFEAIQEFERPFSTLSEFLKNALERCDATQIPPDRFEKDIRVCLASVLGRDTGEAVAALIDHSDDWERLRTTFTNYLASSESHRESVRTVLMEHLSAGLPSERSGWFPASGGMLLLAGVFLSVLLMRLPRASSCAPQESSGGYLYQMGMRTDRITDIADKLRKLNLESVDCFDRGQSEIRVSRRDVAERVRDFLQGFADEIPLDAGDTVCDFVVRLPSHPAPVDPACASSLSSGMEKLGFAVAALYATLGVMLLAYVRVHVSGRVQEGRVSARADELLSQMSRRRLFIRHADRVRAATEAFDLAHGQMKNAGLADVPHISGDLSARKSVDSQGLSALSRILRDWQQALGDERGAQIAALEADIGVLEGESLPGICTSLKKIQSELSQAQAAAAKEIEEISNKLDKAGTDIETTLQQYAQIESQRTRSEAQAQQRVAKINQIAQECTTRLANVKQRFESQKSEAHQQYLSDVAELEEKQKELAGLLSEKEVLESLEVLMTPEAFERVQQRHLGLGVDDLAQRIAGGRFTNWAGQDVSAPARRASSYVSSMHLLQAVIDAHRVFRLEGGVQSSCRAAELVVEHGRSLGTTVTWSRAVGDRQTPASASKVSFVVTHDGVPLVDHIHPI